MTTISSAGTMAGAGGGILDRAHDCSRWLQSLAGAACGALYPSLYRHGLRLLGVLAAAVARDRTDRAEGVPGHLAIPGIVHHHLRLEGRKPGLDVHVVFVFLGISAAIWGGWLERVGPRKAGFVAALCWCGGLVLGAIGVYIHQLWLMWLGAGVVGGVGLGLGYISPVSTLIKWFPDRRGMATGMAIMGFGGGAMIGAPLVCLIEILQDPDRCRRLGDLHRPRRHLFLLHDDRRTIVRVPARRLEARRLYTAERDEDDDHRERRLSSTTRTRRRSSG